MALDLYSPCPCGSGKKFKWCCQPIRAQIDKAISQDAEGQHEAALRIMAEVVAQNPANPEAWGQQARLLFQNDRVEEAENALNKALEINSNYPYGHFLRGMFRLHEGEFAGALLLFRKATELYDPEARDILAQVYAMIGDAEMRLNRPVATHAALKICMHLQPSEELRQALDETFGDQSRLPAVARRDYTFASPPATTSTERREAWNRALSGAATGKLTDAARAFQQLIQENSQDAPAWYNLALARAWLGDNSAAVEALDRYVSLEPDENRAGAAWALCEVLRFGHGMEDQADYVQHSAVYQIREPQRFFDFLQEWQQERRLAAVRVREEEGIISGLVLDRAGLLTAGSPTNQPAKLGAYVLLAGNILRLWNSNAEALARAREELEQRAGPSLSEAQLRRGPANFSESLSEALFFPVGVTEPAEVEKQLRDHMQRYFEESWIHRPLRSLNSVPPVDAAGHAVLRKKLIGVVQFLEDCASSGSRPYDFERLRRELGLVAASAAAQPETGGAAADIDAMSAAELAALPPESLSDEQVDQAYRAAQKLDARELADRFARALIARPPHPDRPDRFPWYTYLVQRALADGDTNAALDFVNEGEKADCEHNQGRHRNDYELRRGQVLIKRGETESARDVFERLFERLPSELRYRGTATESMLAAREGATALRFAEQGLAKAREKNDRDSEQYFMELVAAAQKQASGGR